MSFTDLDVHLRTTRVFLSGGHCVPVPEALAKLKEQSAKPSWWPPFLWPDPDADEIVEMAVEMGRMESRFGRAWLVMYNAEMGK